VIVSLTGVPSCDTVTAEDDGVMLKEVGGVTMIGVVPPPPPQAVMNAARRRTIRVRCMGKA
jgi:hypothetical protein